MKGLAEFQRPLLAVSSIDQRNTLFYLLELAWDSLRQSKDKAREGDRES